MIPLPKDSRWHAVTVLGLGHLRPAPGTWGSLPPVALAGLLVIGGLGPSAHPIVYHAVLLGICLAASASCVAFGEWAESWYGKKDPGWVVADETAGQAVALLALPSAASGGFVPLVITLGVAFLSFRLMDIIKPQPADWLQKFPGGWGVLLDDLAAGVYALLATQLIAHMIF